VAKPKVAVYTHQGDPYGTRAQALLRAKKVKFSVKESNDTYITIGSWKGTYEELGSLDLQGKLDELLQ
jgi:hypothetical protein